MPQACYLRMQPSLRSRVAAQHADLAHLMVKLWCTCSTIGCAGADDYLRSVILPETGAGALPLPRVAAPHQDCLQEHSHSFRGNGASECSGKPS